VVASLPAKYLEPRRGRRQIDQRAWACLDRCRKKLGLESIPLPIPVEDWIEGPLGIQFGFSDLSHLGDDVLGAAYVYEREILIDERVLQHEGRFRFTCAHELGHVILHKNVRDLFQESQNVGMFDSTDRYERQADQFAAAFLMPTPLLENELISVCDEAGLKRAEAVITLMRPTLESEWLWRKHVLPRITRRFGVSVTSAIYRFGDVELKVQNTRELLPREFAQELLQPTEDPHKFDSVQVENGVPVQRDLFTGSKK